MRALRVVTAVLFSVTCLAIAGTASAAGIAVGSSSLISALDYSDTFTIAAKGGISARVDGQYPFLDVASAAQAENCYGNVARSWTHDTNTGYTLFGSINTDATANGGIYGYPGTSDAGSATGFTQNGGGNPVYADTGIAYDLRNRFAVQFDAITLTDRCQISFGSANDTVAPADGLSIIFYGAGHGPDGAKGQFGLYAGGAGLVMSGISSGLPDTRTWHNLGAKIDLDAKTIDVYTDEILRGHVDLNTYAGGAFLSKINDSSNNYVSIGGGGDDRIWFDNFQIGATVPEPTTLSLLVSGVVGLLAYAWRRHK